MKPLSLLLLLLAGCAAHRPLGAHWFPSCNAQNAGRVVTIHANGDWQRCELSNGRYGWKYHAWNPLDWQDK